MTADFNKALDYVLKNEGGFVDDPYDPGGATNQGITLESLHQFLRRSVGVAELKALSVLDVKDFYRQMFWRPLNCDKIEEQAVATALFDSAVLFGLTGAVVCAQRAAVNQGRSIQVDGQIGLLSLVAINGITPKNFIAEFVPQLGKRISDIIEKRPKSEKFRKGWVARIEKLKTLVPV